MLLGRARKSILSGNSLNSWTLPINKYLLPVFIKHRQRALKLRQDQVQNLFISDVQPILVLSSQCQFLALIWSQHLDVGGESKIGVVEYGSHARV